MTELGVTHPVRFLFSFKRACGGDAIVRRLSELCVEERHRAHINARSGSRASPAATFLATDADIPQFRKDPTKNMRPSCEIRGKTGHSKSACFHNKNATCATTITRAPVRTPLYRKQHAASVMGSQPPPRNGGRRKATNSGSARALAASS